MDLERARAVADVARVLVDTAKAEVAFLNVTGQTQGTGFIPQPTVTVAASPEPRKLARV